MQFNITEDDLAPLLSYHTCIELGLITIKDCDSPSTSSGIKNTPSVGVTVEIADLLGEYKDVFGGLGDLPGEYHIVTDDTVPPVIHPPRRVPVALRDQIKEKLDEMVASGILAPVTEPTETKLSPFLPSASMQTIQLNILPITAQLFFNTY